MNIDQYLKILYKKYRNIGRGSFDGIGKLYPKNKHDEVKDKENQHEAQRRVDYINTAKPSKRPGRRANKIPFSFKRSRKRADGE